MKKIFFISTLLFITACVFQEPLRYRVQPDEQIPSIEKELRGAWVTRFAYADENPDSMRIKIISVMKNLGDANFNAVFFQIRGQCETLYPSPLEPWSKLINFTDPGFDPLQLAIDEARKNGLKFYAYINLLPMWNESDGPKDQSHIFYMHGPNVSANQSWVCTAGQDTSGKPSSYFYLNPALPQVQTYLKKVVRHVVETYDIDGLHFDRIRYPGSAYLNDPHSTSQFRKDSLASGISKAAWARKQLTDLVEAVVVEAMLIKPYLVNSAATWGMYRTGDMQNYSQFGSGYGEYYQDAIDWLDKGIMDFIVPMIYWDLDDPLPNFDDLWLDFKKRTPNYKSIFPGLRIYSCDWIETGETASQINFMRQEGGQGSVMFSIGANPDSRLKIIKNTMYPEKVALPDHMKRVKPQQVFGLNLNEILLDEKAGNEIRLMNDAFRKKTDLDGKLNFILPDKPDSLHIRYADSALTLSTAEWNLPYNYRVQKDGAVHRDGVWVEMRRIPRDTTHSPEFPILCKTEYPAKAWINDDTVKVYKTGVFFNKINLTEGVNRITAKVEYPDSTAAVYANEYYFQSQDTKRAALPLWIDHKSFEPAEDIALLAEDKIRISFKASKEQEAKIFIESADVTLKCARKDFDDFSLYQAELPLRLLNTGEPAELKIVLKPATESGKYKTITYTAPVKIRTKELDEYPLIKTIKKNSVLEYSLGPIRLGSPVRAEYPAGIILQSSGKIGKNYRVRLSAVENGYIHERYVQELEENTISPEYYIRSLFCAPSDSGDILVIPHSEPGAYTVHPEPNLKRIAISLYGVTTSSTWITHRKDRRVIDKVTWQQTTPNTYTIYVNLISAKIWGYDIKKVGRSLVFRIKYPPEMDSNPELPLNGIKIAIEAGHGGRNLGAVGLSGIKEKDINLSLSLMVEEICRANGAEVVQIRPTDRYMFLGSKRDSSLNSAANLHISIHANAGGGRGGYLGVSGTSTYYHNPFWAPLADKIYDNLLELDLIEFGVIGSFNYKVTRMSALPSILVEQAFLSHAGDEEKLADQQFRKDMAQKIYEGILDYLDYMQKD